MEANICRGGVWGIVTVALGICSWSLAAARQQPATPPRIGFLGAMSEVGHRGPLEAFRQGLRELGYVEGKNLVVEFRWTEGTEAGTYV